MSSVDFGMVLTIALGVALGLILFNGLAVVFALFCEWAKESQVAIWLVVIGALFGLAFLAERFYPNETASVPTATPAKPMGASGRDVDGWFAENAPNASPRVEIKPEDREGDRSIMEMRSKSGRVWSIGDIWVNGRPITGFDKDGSVYTRP